MSDYDYKDVAHEYDKLVQQHKWQAPELLFAFLSQYLQPGMRLLDIGVGTGIASQRFHTQQVELHGLDGSADMLAICEAKGVFEEVGLIDIGKEDIPYADAWFDCVICSGLFHFFESLEAIFAKVDRVIKIKGLFACTFIENHKDSEPIYSETTDGVAIYHHSKGYLYALAKQFQFSALHEKTFTSLTDLNTQETLTHTLVVFGKE